MVPLGLETLCLCKPFGWDSGVQDMKYDGNLTAKCAVETSVIRPFSLFPWKWLPFSLLLLSRDVVPLLSGLP